MTFTFGATAAGLQPVPRRRTADVTSQVDFSVTPRFSSPATFAGLPRAEDVGDIDIAIMGVPFDSGVTYRPGARFGPGHIRGASRLLRPFNADLGALPFDHAQVADMGDLAVTPFSIDEAIRTVERAARAILERSRRLLVLGGDHTIALPNLRALSAVHGRVSVLHFDAHLDTWGDYFGSAYHHGSPFRRASEEGLLDPEGCVHVGIRGPLYGLPDIENDRALGFAITRCEQIQQNGLADAIAAVKARLADRPVYVSIDIDVLDPAFAPGTGTPEPGGLLSRELLSFLRSLTGVNIVGADIVEVSPSYDHADITGFAAAHIAYELLSLWAVHE
ncbi:MULTISPECIES: agmatinase [unclassified Mycolicibacterium]|uniref:agmatinase n=1 Tax=unclassified Mycolicibacterium TaxID=2636767 RepID=UPI002EDB76DF